MRINNNDTILAVGSIAIDALETPNGNRENVLGGSATYFSIAASLFAPIKIVGVVGTDFPEFGWQVFRSKNINVENIQIMNGKTFRWGGRYNQDYSIRDTLFTDLGVFDSFNPTIKPDDSAPAWVFLGNIQPRLQLDVVQLLQSYNYIITDTMNLWIDLNFDTLSEVLAITDIFLLNHEEAFQYTGTNDLEVAASNLHEKGPSVIIIKMGAEGAYLSSKNSSHMVPVFPIQKIIDPTGAGDAFAGGFVGCLATSNKIDFLKATITGCAIASFVVEDFGINTLLNISMDELQNRINFINNIIRT